MTAKEKERNAYLVLYAAALTGIRGNAKYYGRAEHGFENTEGYFAHLATLDAIEGVRLLKIRFGEFEDDPKHGRYEKPEWYIG